MKKRMRWLVLCVGALAGCGGDDAVSPTPDYAAAWVGEYDGNGSFALSNGVSGSDRPTSILIEQITPKQISVNTRLVYGTGRNDFTTSVGLLNPTSPEQFTAEYRSGTSRTVYALELVADTLRGSIVTSTVRINGSWTEDQRMIVEVVRQ